MSDIAVGGFGFFMVLILYVAPIILIVFAVRWAVSGGIWEAAKNTEETSGEQPARQTLGERYASGEIGRDEYRQIRRDTEAE